MQVFDQGRMEGCLPELNDDQRTALGRVFLDTLEMLGVNQANGRRRSVQTRRRPRQRRRLSPPEDHEPAPDTIDPTLAAEDAQVLFSIGNFNYTNPPRDY
jgi:hypothetical protein